MGFLEEWRDLIMKVVGGDSRVFMQSLRPAALYNSWNKGQEFIKPVYIQEFENKL